MTEADIVSLTPSEVKAVDAYTHTSEAANAAKLDAIAKQLEDDLGEPGAPQPPTPGAQDTSPGSPSSVVEAPVMDAEDAEFFLELGGDLFLSDEGRWRALDAEERAKVAPRAAAVWNRYMPWLDTNHREAVGLAIVLLVVYGKRVKQERLERKARAAQEKADAAARKKNAPTSPASIEKDEPGSPKFE